MSENKSKNENLIIDKTITENTATEDLKAETGDVSMNHEGITLPLIWHAKDKEELLDSTFNHSTETVRKDTKADWLLTAIGVFAVICFGIMLYQCIHYNSFTFTNYICFICYAIIAILFIPKPMQYFISKMSWKAGLSKFAAASNNAGEVTLHDEKAEFAIGKKTVNVSYKYMEAIFETVNYFVLMVESKRILTFEKADLTDEQIAGVRKILGEYLSSKTEDNESSDDKTSSDENTFHAENIETEHPDTDDEA